jgi:hypothetical protein
MTFLEMVVGPEEFGVGVSAFLGIATAAASATGLGLIVGSITADGASLFAVGEGGREW